MRQQHPYHCWSFFAHLTRPGRLIRWTQEVVGYSLERGWDLRSCMGVPQMCGLGSKGGVVLRGCTGGPELEVALPAFDWVLGVRLTNMSG